MNSATVPSEISASCPHCTKPLSYPEKFLGMTSPCPYCKGDVVLTDPVHRSENPSVPGESLAPEWAEQVLVILRWLAILPGAFLAATIAGGAIMFIFGS